MVKKTCESYIGYSYVHIYITLLVLWAIFSFFLSFFLEKVCVCAFFLGGGGGGDCVRVCVERGRGGGERERFLCEW